MSGEMSGPARTPDSDEWQRAQDAFAAAAAWYVETAAAAAGRWEEPGLGVWTVRDLVGHTSRSLLLVEAYLDTPVAAAEVRSAVAYYGLAMSSVGDPAAVAQRGRNAGAALGDDIPRAVAEIAGRVVPRVTAANGGELVATPVGGMYLTDYLPTRTFELAVHTCDLAAALGRPMDVPPAAAAATVTLLGELANARGVLGPMLLAATGRGPLPAGFTVL